MHRHRGAGARGPGSTGRRRMRHPGRQLLARAPAPPNPLPCTGPVRRPRGRRPVGRHTVGWCPVVPPDAPCPGARRPAPSGAGRPRAERPSAIPVALPGPGPSGRVADRRSGPSRRVADRQSAVPSCGLCSVRCAAARQRSRPGLTRTRRSRSLWSHALPAGPDRRPRHHDAHLPPRPRPLPPRPCRPPLSPFRSCARIRPYRTIRERLPCPYSGWRFRWCPNPPLPRPPDRRPEPVLLSPDRRVFRCGFRNAHPLRLPEPGPLRPRCFSARRPTPESPVFRCGRPR